MALIDFGGTLEKVITREEYSLEKAKSFLGSDKKIAVLGYGVQGPGQAMNLRDNGFTVIIGQRENSPSWDKAVADGWEPNKQLFPVLEAVAQADVIMYLLSDAGQIQLWPEIAPLLRADQTLYFSHGFGLTFHEKTGIIPPKDMDVIMVAPKGSGTSLRRLFLEGKGVNASLAVFQDVSSKAEETAIALAMGIGSAYVFYTDVKKEVYSDLTGERGSLMGAVAGLFEAQYEVLRANGHSPSEAFNETVEELTQSLMPLVAENGMDWMFANTSTTAQRGALDWKKRFKALLQPAFHELYESVASGREAERSIATNSQTDYREKLELELKEIHESELWQAGRAVRSLRP